MPYTDIYYLSHATYTVTVPNWTLFAIIFLQYDLKEPKLDALLYAKTQ
jgi:hypothetical protein